MSEEEDKKMRNDDGFKTFNRPNDHLVERFRERNPALNVDPQERPAFLNVADLDYGTTNKELPERLAHYAEVFNVADVDGRLYRFVEDLREAAESIPVEDEDTDELVKPATAEEDKAFDAKIRELHAKMDMSRARDVLHRIMRWVESQDKAGTLPEDFPESAGDIDNAYNDLDTLGDLSLYDELREVIPTRFVLG